MTKLSCANCGAKSKRDYSYHKKYRMEFTGREVLAPHQNVSPHLQVRRVMEDEKVRVDVPYTGNLKIVRETDDDLTLWDGESYRLDKGLFCTLRCALSFATAAHQLGYRRKEQES